MNIFQIICHNFFADYPVEAYSFWIKKRVLVFEKHPAIKIKLSVEPDEEGALLYIAGCCNFKTLEAIFIYRHKDFDKFNITGITGDIQNTEQALAELEQICKDCNIKLVVLSDKDRVSNNILYVNASNYVGRSAENFIKERPPEH